MNLRTRLERVESEVAALDQNSGPKQIAELAEAQVSVAVAITRLKDVTPVNDYDAESLTHAIAYLNGVFSTIGSLLAERGVALDEYLDGTFKPSHLKAFVSVLEGDPDDKYGDKGEDPPVDPAKFRALSRPNRQIVREAIRILQSRDGKQLSEIEKSIVAGTI